ncbi:MAG: MoaD/ThiS family protein [Anaerolineales bacterium]
MKVYLKSIGDLHEYIGRGPQEIDLPDGARFGQLLALIGQRWGKSLPPFIWDADKQQFRGALFFVVDKQVVQDMDMPLKDGQEVLLMRALSGG